LRTRAIPERLRGVFTTRRYTNTPLPLPLLFFVVVVVVVVVTSTLREKDFKIHKTGKTLSPCSQQPPDYVALQY